jgi:cell division transport system permease protein
MFTLFKRIFRAGWKSFSRDGSQNIATIFILVMTIGVITSLFLFKDVSQFLISGIQEKVDISVYFKFEAEETDILNFKEKIAEIPEIKEIKYVSKEAALEDFIEKHKDDPVLIESLEELGMNPFLASLNIRAFEASQYEAIASFLESSNFTSIIEKVDYYQRKPVIERIFSLTSNLSLAGIILSIILAIIAVLVAFNTIRLAIYNCREEIKIQRLVGASNLFIRGPFLTQGAISGFLAALISSLLFFLICWVFSPKLEFLFPGLNVFNIFISSFWLILLIQLVAGIGLGVVSSLLAIRRYLEV